MKCTSAYEWKVGDKGRTNEGLTVTVEAIQGGRYLKIAERNIEKQVYIPAHGEIEKI